MIATDTTMGAMRTAVALKAETCGEKVRRPLLRLVADTLVGL
jgi:hypothetical protein